VVESAPEAQPMSIDVEELRTMIADTRKAVVDAGKKLRLLTRHKGDLADTAPFQKKVKQLGKELTALHQILRAFEESQARKKSRR